MNIASIQRTTQPQNPNSILSPRRPEQVGTNYHFQLNRIAPYRRIN